MKPVTSMLTTLMILMVQGCTVQKVLVPTGGSRADGTISMSYEVGELDIPVIDPQQGARDAGTRCAVWGYTGAQPFGGETRRCIDRSAKDCNRWQVTIEYQCLGTPAASR